MKLPKKFEVPVVGVTFVPGYPETLDSLSRDEKVELVRDRNNDSDPNAISVRTTDGQPLGFIPAAVARRLAPAMDAGETFEATIRPVVHDDHRDRPGAMLAVDTATPATPAAT